MRRAGYLVFVLASVVALVMAGCGDGDGGDGGDGGAGEGGQGTNTPTPTATTSDGGDGGGTATAASGGGGGQDEMYTLTVSVTGESHVAFNTVDLQEHVCPGDCTADFPWGSVAEIRRRTLDQEEEKSWRLSAWGADCARIDAEKEVSGGRCQVNMTEDHSVTVEFAPRPEVRFVQTGSNVDVQYQLAYDPVAQLGGNPAAARGTITCHLPGCVDTEVIGHYDLGTQITVTLSELSLDDFVGFSGACSGKQNPCEFTVMADTELTIAWVER